MSNTVATRPDPELASIALARVVEAWGDPAGCMFRSHAHDGAIEVEVKRGQTGVVIAMNPTVLDPSLSPPELLVEEIRRRRARLDIELAELAAAA